MIRFQVIVQKIKNPRVEVLRAITSKNGELSWKLLGSFTDKKGPASIVKQLTSEELYQFENYFNLISFAKNIFSCNADKLDRFIIKVPLEFKEALFKIWGKSQEYHLNYMPEFNMIESAFHQAQIMEQNLSIVTNGEFQALETLGIDVTDVHPPKQDLSESQLLLLECVKVADSLEDLAEHFTTTASKKYGKSTQFKGNNLERLANSKKPTFPKWYYTVAIDVLMDLGIKPDTVISPGLLAQHWLRLNKKETLETTLKIFAKTFDHLKENPLSINAIKMAFVQDELRKMSSDERGASLIPSYIFEKWLARLQKRKPEITKKLVIEEFNHEFPSLKNNVFFLRLIEKYYPPELEIKS